MKHGLFSIVGLLALALMSVSASPAGAATAAGPYYATPSWDQTLQCDTPATCPRFIVLSNFASAAVLDRETGLVWEQSPATTTNTWAAARFDCTNRTTGGRKGWRLPSVHELASLVDPSVASPGPTLPPGHPFMNVQSSQYWSAATDAAFPTGAWTVVFFSGDLFTANKGGSGFVWCVRGGMNADQY